MFKLLITTPSVSFAYLSVSPLPPTFPMSPSPPLSPSPSLPPTSATGGELFRMIAVDPLPEDKARSVVLQLLEGVEHLHSLNIVHLDLKASVFH